MPEEAVLDPVERDATMRNFQRYLTNEAMDTAARAARSARDGNRPTGFDQEWSAVESQLRTEFPNLPFNSMMAEESYRQIRDNHFRTRLMAEPQEDTRTLNERAAEAQGDDPTPWVGRGPTEQENYNRGRYWIDRLPVLGHVFNIGLNNEQTASLQRIRDGSGTQEDYMGVGRALAYQDSMTNRNNFQLAGDVLSQSASFAAEFYMAAPVGELARGSTAAGLAGRAGETLQFVLPRAAQGFAMTAPMAANLTQAVSERLVPDVSFDENGQISVGRDPTFADAAWRGYLDTQIEIFSELAGGQLLRGSGRLVGMIPGSQRASATMAGLASWWRRTTGGTPAAWVEHLHRAGINGVFGEFLEERLGEGARSLAQVVGGDRNTGGMIGAAMSGRFRDALDQLAVEGMAFGGYGVTSNIAGGLANTIMRRGMPQGGPRFLSMPEVGEFGQGMMTPEMQVRYEATAARVTERNAREFARWAATAPIDEVEQWTGVYEGLADIVAQRRRGETPDVRQAAQQNAEQAAREGFGEPIPPSQNAQQGTQEARQGVPAPQEAVGPTQPAPSGPAQSQTAAPGLRIGSATTLNKGDRMSPAEARVVDKYGPNAVTRVDLHNAAGESVGTAVLAEEGDSIWIDWIGAHGMAAGEGGGNQPFEAAAIMDLYRQIAEAMPEMKFLKYIAAAGKKRSGKQRTINLDRFRDKKGGMAAKPSGRLATDRSKVHDKTTSGPQQTATDRNVAARFGGMLARVKARSAAVQAQAQPSQTPRRIKIDADLLEEMLAEREQQSDPDAEKVKNTPWEAVPEEIKQATAELIRRSPNPAATQETVRNIFALNGAEGIREMLAIHQERNQLLEGIDEDEREFRQSERGAGRSAEAINRDLGAVEREARETASPERAAQESDALSGGVERGSEQAAEVEGDAFEGEAPNVTYGVPNRVYDHILRMYQNNNRYEIDEFEKLAGEVMDVGEAMLQAEKRHPIQKRFALLNVPVLRDSGIDSKTLLEASRALRRGEWPKDLPDAVVDNLRGQMGKAPRSSSKRQGYQRQDTAASRRNAVLAFLEQELENAFGSREEYLRYHQAGFSAGLRAAEEGFDPSALDENALLEEAQRNPTEFPFGQERFRGLDRYVQQVLIDIGEKIDTKKGRKLAPESKQIRSQGGMAQAREAVEPGPSLFEGVEPIAPAQRAMMKKGPRPGTAAAMFPEQGGNPDFQNFRKIQAYEIATGRSYMDRAISAIIAVTNKSHDDAEQLFQQLKEKAQQEQLNRGHEPGTAYGVSWDSVETALNLMDQQQGHGTLPLEQFKRLLLATPTLQSKITPTARRAALKGLVPKEALDYLDTLANRKRRSSDQPSSIKDFIQATKRFWEGEPTNEDVEDLFDMADQMFGERAREIEEYVEDQVLRETDDADIESAVQGMMGEEEGSPDVLASRKSNLDPIKGEWTQAFLGAVASDLVPEDRIHSIGDHQKWINGKAWPARDRLEKLGLPDDALTRVMNSLDTQLVNAEKGMMKAEEIQRHLTMALLWESKRDSKIGEALKAFEAETQKEMEERTSGLDWRPNETMPEDYLASRKPARAGLIDISGVREIAAKIVRDTKQIDDVTELLDNVKKAKPALEARFGPKQAAKLIRFVEKYAWTIRAKGEKAVDALENVMLQSLRGAEPRVEALANQRGSEPPAAPKQTQTEMPKQGLSEHAIIKRMLDLFDIPKTVDNLTRQRTAEALYLSKPWAILIKGVNVGNAVIHLEEVIHHIDNFHKILFGKEIVKTGTGPQTRYRFNYAQVPQNVQTGLRRVFNSMGRNEDSPIKKMHEGLAEIVRMKVMGEPFPLDRPTQEAVAWVEQQLAPHEGTLKRLNEISNMFRALRGLTPIEYVASLHSATGQPANAYNVPFQERMWGRLEEMMRDFSDSWIYDLGPIARAEARAKQLGFSPKAGKLPTEVIAAQRHSKAAWAEQYEDNGIWVLMPDGHRQRVSMSIKEMLAPLAPFADTLLKGINGGVTPFEVFLTARHVVFLADQYDALSPEEQKKSGKPMSDEQIAMMRQALTEFSPEHTAALTQAANNYRDLMNSTLDAIGHIALLDKAKVEELKAKFPYYSSLRRVAEEFTGAMGKARGERMSAGIYRRKGESGREIASPLQSLLGRLSMVARLQAEQNVRISIDDMFDTGTPGKKGPGVEGIGKWMHRMETPLKHEFRIVDKADLIKALDRESGEPGLFDELMELVGDRLSFYFTTPTTESGEPAYVVFRRITEAQLRDKFTPEEWNALTDEQREIEAGAVLEHWYVVKDKSLHSLLTGAWNNFDIPPHLQMILTPLRLAASVTKTAATTLNPKFQITNLMRDVQTWFQNTTSLKDAAQLPAWYVRAYAFNLALLTSGKEKAMNDVLASMYHYNVGEMQRLVPPGQEGLNEKYRRMTEQEGWREAIGEVKTMGKMVMNVLNAGEKGPRLAEFASALAEFGWTEEKIKEELEKDPNKEPVPYNVIVYALNKANEVTVPFDRGGWKSRQVNQYIPFFMATISATNKYGRQWMENPKRMGVVLAVYMALEVIHALLMKDEPWYNEQEPHLRYRYWAFPLFGRLYRIPKPQGLQNGATASFQEGLRYLLNKDPRMVDAAWQMAGEIMPPYVPAGMQPGVDILRNQDFSGRPIVPRGEEGASGNFLNYQLPHIARNIPGVGPAQDIYRQGWGGLAAQTGATVGSSPNASVDRLFDRLRSLEADRLQARRGGRQFPQEGEYQRLSQAADRIRALSDRIRGNGGMGAALPAEEQRRLRDEQIAIARQVS